MTRNRATVCGLGLAAALVSVVVYAQRNPPGTYGPRPTLAEPKKSDTKKYSTMSKWPAGELPKAPEGFRVQRFAEGLVSPRWIYVLDDGSVLVAEASTKPKPARTPEDEAKQKLLQQSGSMRESADRITWLRDANGDGIAEQRAVFLAGLSQPLGMAVVRDGFYVANTDAVMRYPWKPGLQSIQGKGEQILELPAGGYNNHWTRNLLANSAGTKLYVSVGSASNIAEHGIAEERRRANILEINPDGSGERIYASGLRNPVGMDWEPVTGRLWAAVNERDNIGDDLVPDYITSVRPGGFYGWPWSYFGSNVDARVQPAEPDFVKKAIVPDFAVGAHTASLGFTFYKANAFPERYRGGAFVGQHGSWNRTAFSGYKVIFVPFREGRPAGPVEDFLTGFLADPANGTTYGRPVGVAVDRTGALLVADDTGDVIWRISADRR